MDTVVHSDWQPDSSVGAATESVCHRLDEEDWLAPSDAHQIETALSLSERKRIATTGRWSVSFAAAVLCHVLAVAAVALLCARSGPIVRWQVVRGDPSAADSSSKTRPLQREDAIAENPAIVAPPSSSPPTASRESAMDQSLGDLSSLPDRLDLSTVSPVDTVIGIGVAEESQRLPHFASPKFHVATSSSKTAAIQPVGRPVGGDTTPPRVAGPRGERDGFDSRGLPIPDYPYESQRRGEQGVVIVDVEVLPDGRVGAVHIASDAGYPRLGAAAAEKVKLATFEPARVNGTPVVGHIRIPYRFTLQ